MAAGEPSEAVAKATKAATEATGEADKAAEAATKAATEAKAAKAAGRAAKAAGRATEAAHTATVAAGEATEAACTATMAAHTATVTPSEATAATEAAHTATVAASRATEAAGQAIKAAGKATEVAREGSKLIAKTNNHDLLRQMLTSNMIREIAQVCTSKTQKPAAIGDFCATPKILGLATKVTESESVDVRLELAKNSDMTGSTASSTKQFTYNVTLLEEDGLANFQEASANLTDFLSGGLVPFLTDVIEGEVKQRVLDKLKKQISGEPKYWLPATYALLGGTMTSQSLGAAFKHALISDLMGMPRRLVKKSKVTDSSLRMGFELLDIFLRTSDPLAVLEELETIYGDKDGYLLLLKDVFKYVSRRHRDDGAFADAMAVAILAQLHCLNDKACMSGIPELLDRVKAVRAAAENAVAIGLSGSARIKSVIPYVEAMIGTINFAMSVKWIGNAKHISREVLPLFAAAASKDVTRFATTLIAIIKAQNIKLIDAKKLDDAALRLLTMGAELASAKNPSDFTRILIAYSGASNSRAKRNQLNVALFVGGGGGGAWSADTDNDGIGQDGWEAGASALAGIQLSLGDEDNETFWWGPFFSVADGLASASIRNSGLDSTESKFKATPASMFSPGLYLNLNYSGLSLMAGGSILPFGAKVTTANSLDEPKTNNIVIYRAHVLLGFNIGLFELSGD